MRKIWVHPTFKATLEKYNYPMWIYDGSRLAWSPALVDRGELRLTVDLDDGKPSNGARSNKFHITIRKTTEIQLGVLQGYLERKMQFNNSVQEALNFMDHLIRQWPSEHMLGIKRQFFKTGIQGRMLMDGGVVEVHKGTYVSLRLSQNLARGGLGLALNADVTNTCFWVGGRTMDELMLLFLGTCDKRWRGMNCITIINHLRPVPGGPGEWRSSDAFKQLRKLRKLKFTVKHANRRDNNAVYTVADFVFDPRHGSEGANAKNVTFDYNGRDITVAAYYQEKYKAYLKYSNLPLIKTPKGALIPMEYAHIEPMQRYTFKLNPDQTAAMIKIAVTRPNVRKGDIQKNFADLKIPSDPYLKHYGIEFETQFSKTEAKILAPPAVNFKQGVADPKFSGRWDLRGKKFWQQNIAPLQNWGFLVMDDAVNLPQLQNFSRTFKTTFLGHGGKCTNDPMLLNTPGEIKTNIAKSIEWAMTQLQTGVRGYPQLLFVVVQHKNSPHYERLKKSADCRFGILSQVVNGSQVINNNGQYHSNVCLKVNAKLGGATSRTLPPWKLAQTYFPKERPTMIIGVDISHPAPGGVSSSVAAMTMSVDPDATRYAAHVQNNGHRIEMLTQENVKEMFGSLSGLWRTAHSNAIPKHIIYFRDGVAEGQFAQVVEKEIDEIKAFFKNVPPPKFTVIVATKRHHIRFFPQKGDKNGNALPGTLVEKEVTHPFMWDFYLCSHVAIQGTARPVHYHVILDEMGIPANELQKMIYHQCYSYARSTTPVSLHPAVYYAHLAGSRARCHEDIASSEGMRHGAKGHEMIRDRVAKGQSLGPQYNDNTKLLRLGGNPEKQPSEAEIRQRQFIRGTMWYI